MVLGEFMPGAVLCAALGGASKHHWASFLPRRFGANARAGWLMVRLIPTNCHFVGHAFAIKPPPILDRISLQGTNFLRISRLGDPPTHQAPLFQARLRPPR